MREIDAQTTNLNGTPSLVLMENAAAAVARAVSEYLSGEVAGKRILVLCGKGNNGGDGAAAARLLATAGARIDVVLIGKIEAGKGDARINFDRLQSWRDEQALREDRQTVIADSGAINLFECDSEKAWEQLLTSVLSFPADVVIDALFGTGLTRPVEGLHAEAIKYLQHLCPDRDSNRDRTSFIVSVDRKSVV